MICVLLDFIYLALISDSCNLHSDKRNLHTHSHWVEQAVITLVILLLSMAAMFLHTFQVPAS